MLKLFRLGLHSFEVGYGLTSFKLSWVVNINKECYRLGKITMEFIFQEYYHCCILV